MKKKLKGDSHYFQSNRVITLPYLSIMLSQAAACDGNVYAIPQGAIVTKTTPTPSLSKEETLTN